MSDLEEYTNEALERHARESAIGNALLIYSRRLEAIVNALPKFADGSPIQFGVEVFAIKRPSGLPVWVKAVGKATHLRANGVDCLNSSKGDWSFVESSDAYPTLEAANVAVSTNTKSPCPVCGRATALAAKEKRP